jgi:CubicO group peptidase (beta-lactamase class C family)
MTTLNGYLAPGFEEIGRVFERNFEEFGEIGAAFAATWNGEPVVDIWGGLADRSSGTAWSRDSLQLIFSGTKGLVAICMLILIERGQIELDAPVARYWPAFGKSNVCVRDIFMHTARLPGFVARVTIDELMDDVRLSALLASQEQNSDPRAGFCYHALTYGWLAGELVRKVDGRSVGRFFADEVARPLELEIWVGLPPNHKHRVTTLELASNWGISPHLQAEVYERDLLMRQVWGNPEWMTPRAFPWNRADFHAAEIAGVNGIVTARSLAKLYGVLACGGAPLMTERTVQLARSTLKAGFDELHNVNRRFGVGFQLQTETKAYGPPPDAFGHPGAGGSTHGAWPELRVGFSYAMNLMRDGDVRDPRSGALIDALHTAVRRIK